MIFDEISKYEIAAELIGTATTEKDGLMPSSKAMLHLNSKAGDITKLSILNNKVGFNFLFSIVKNHENTGFAFGFLYGCNKKVAAYVIKEGRYLNDIKVIYNETGLDIYFNCSSYTCVCLDAVADCENVNFLFQTVTSIPENAESIYGS